MKNAVNWFEITTTDMDKAQAFYEAVLGRTLRREAMFRRGRRPSSRCWTGLSLSKTVPGGAIGFALACSR
jgi:predicted enzyme related to lactoylglutathione lyase